MSGYREPEKLVYILGHKYTDANLRLSHLKGRDRAKADQLNTVCKDAGFCLLLANLERERSGGCEDGSEDDWGGSWSYGYSGHRRDREAVTDSSSHEDEEFASDEESEYGEFHPIIDVIDETLRLSTVVQNDGSPMAKDITLDEEDIIQSNSFKRAPDNEDYEGYTGNEGTTTTHYYRSSCLVIMPREDIVKFLINPSTTKTVNLQPALEGLIEQVRVSTDDQASKSELARACKYIIEKQQTAKLNISDANLVVLADAAFAIRRPSIFESAASCIRGMLPVEVLKELGAVIAWDGLKVWQAAFDAATDSPKNMHQRLRALCIIEDGFKLHVHEDRTVASNLRQLEDLIRAKVESMLSSEADVGSDAASLLLDRVQNYGESFLAQRLLPFVKCHGAKPQFWVSFLNQIFQAGQESYYQPSLVANAFQDALDGLVPNLRIEDEKMNPATQGYGNYGPVPRWPPWPPNASISDRLQPSSATNTTPSGIELAVLIGNCESQGLKSSSKMLIDKLVSVADTVDPSVFGSTLLPMLTTLPKIALSKDIALRNHSFQTLFQQILNRYLHRYVLTEPEEPKDWSMAPKGCGCNDCKELDGFLANATKQTWHFKAAEHRRKHFENRILRGSDFRLDTERSGSPLTLVVTKTRTQWQRDHREWQKRCSNATQSMNAICDEKNVLEDLLGDQYRMIMNLEGIKRQSRLGSVAMTGAKRKAPLTETIQQPTKRGKYEKGAEHVLSVDIIDLESE
ncbi:MAG: hypothetical protein Q9167_004713 [Letrouitia subvulpina]